MSNGVEIPNDHEVLYQDKDMIVTFPPSDDESDEEIAHLVHFWFFDEEDEDPSPVCWDPGTEIVLEESKEEGVTVVVLDVLTEWMEPQIISVDSKIAAILSKRFNRPLRATNTVDLEEHQELLYDSDGCVVILDNTSTALTEGGEALVLVYWDQWESPFQAIWRHDLRDSIQTHSFPNGKLGLIPVLAEGSKEVARAIPMQLVEFLAERFGKRVEDPSKETDKSPPPLPTEDETLLDNELRCNSTPTTTAAPPLKRVVRILWIRILFWISWPVATIFIAAFMLALQGRAAPGGAGALGLLTSTGVLACVLVGMPCAILEVFLCKRRKRKDASVSVPARAFVLPCVCLLLLLFLIAVGRFILGAANSFPEDQVKWKDEPLPRAYEKRNFPPKDKLRDWAAAENRTIGRTATSQDGITMQKAEVIENNGLRLNLRLDGSPQSQRVLLEARENPADFGAGLFRRLSSLKSIQARWRYYKVNYECVFTNPQGDWLIKVTLDDGGVKNVAITEPSRFPPLKATMPVPERQPVPPRAVPVPER